MTFEELYNQLTELKDYIRPETRIVVTTYDGFDATSQELKGVHYYNKVNQINLFGTGNNE